MILSCLNSLCADVSLSFEISAWICAYVAVYICAIHDVSPCSYLRGVSGGMYDASRVTLFSARVPQLIALQAARVHSRAVIPFSSVVAVHPPAQGAAADVALCRRLSCGQASDGLLNHQQSPELLLTALPVPKPMGACVGRYFGY